MPGIDRTMTSPRGFAIPTGRGWQYNVDEFKRCLDDPDSEAITLRERAEKAKAALEPVLAQMRPQQRRRADRGLEILLKAQDVEEFDDGLETLYNWGDDERVWLGKD